MENKVAKLCEEIIFFAEKDLDLRMFENPKDILNRIANIVCSRHKISMQELKGSDRSGRYVFARHEFCFLAINHPKKMFLREIGHFIKRHHSTVINSTNKYSDLLEYNHPTTYGFAKLFKEVLKNTSILDGNEVCLYNTKLQRNE